MDNINDPTFNPFTFAEESNIPLNPIFEENVNVDENPDITVQEERANPTIPRRRKLTSAVWEHYTRTQGRGGEPRATCKYCLKVFSCASTGGTGHLIRHISKVCKNVPQHIRPQQVRGQAQISIVRAMSGAAESSETGSTTPTSGMTQMTNFMYSHQTMRDYMARYVVAIDQPFTFGNDNILEWFVQSSIQPAFRRVPRNTLRSDIIRNYEEMK